jgi:hypothetical protein
MGNHGDLGSDNLLLQPVVPCTREMQTDASERISGLTITSIPLDARKNSCTKELFGGCQTSTKLRALDGE